MKHFEIQDLWIQQLVRNKILIIRKASAHENPSDILTKHVGREWLDRVCKMCNVCSTLFIPPTTPHHSGPKHGGRARAPLKPTHHGSATPSPTVTPRPPRAPHHNLPTQHRRPRLTRSARRTRPPPARPRPTCARRAPCRTSPSPAAPCTAHSQGRWRNSEVAGNSNTPLPKCRAGAAPAATATIHGAGQLRRH